ncbi:MAG TPA: phytanoyl-CoA dioxygenase family protein [Terriglobales bacterium]|jgi:hypothetical protein
MMDVLARDGYSILPETIPLGTIASVVIALENSRSRKGAGIRNVLRIPAVRSLAEDVNLLGLVKRVLGERTVPFRATLFDKSAKSNWLVVWHQDTALPLREKQDVQGWGPWSVKEGVICSHAPARALEQVLAARVHLDDSTSENGPLRVLPGTHTLGVLTDDQIHDFSSTKQAVECRVGVGGVLLMRPLLVHASSKARSDRSRRVLHIEYASQLLCGDGLELAVD